MITGVAPCVCLPIHAVKRPKDGDVSMGSAFRTDMGLVPYSTSCL